ncbi:MAG: response regulator [Lachnospiraceae bacterium]|nr:response regulator [Lachnospiraceae bacterium]
MYQFVIYILYFTIAGLFAVSMFSIRKWNGVLHTYLFFYSVSNLVYDCGYVLILHATDQKTYVTALKMGYLGRVWIGLSMILFVAELAGIKLSSVFKIGGALINIVIYFFILNLESTPLYYKTMTFAMNGDFPTLPHSGGPLYYGYTLLNLAYAIFGTYIIVRAYRHETNEIAKKRNLIMVIVMITLGASYVIYFFKLVALARIFDVMIIGYALCTALMLVAILKFKMLDTITAAKEYVVDELSEGIIVVDSNDRLIFYNKPAQKLFPMLEDEAKSEEDVQKLLDDFDRAVKSGEPIKFGGKVFTPRANPLTDNGISIGTLYSLSDDSEHYRYMDELREQKQIADNANKAKSEFLANTSHEIRTPINAVLGFNEMISREYDKFNDMKEQDPPIIREMFGHIGQYSRNIEAAGNSLLSIINDILDLSKVEAGKMDLSEGEYSLSSLLNEINSMISFRASEKGLEYVTDVDETLPDLLYGDKVRMRQVMINILTNAIKYTDKGTVWFTVRRRDRQKIREGEMLILTVMIKDTGIGIRKEDMDKLFDSFQRLELERNSTIEGTGLGLAISDLLVSMMGGNITVDSEYGAGSTFIITIPQKVISCEPIGNIKVSVDDPGNVRQPYKASFTAPDAHILIVDDTNVNLLVVESLLRDTKIRIDTAHSGSEAVSLCGENKYDLVIMDQRMPNMDGTEALGHIRSQKDGANRDTPIICMSADAVIGARERYIAEGFDDYLSKPINSHELEQALTKHLPQDKIIRE